MWRRCTTDGVQALCSASIVGEVTVSGDDRVGLLDGISKNHRVGSGEQSRVSDMHDVMAYLAQWLS
jgi:hypothetical protein